MASGSLAALVARAAADFAKAGIDEAELEARLLAQRVFGLDHAGLILHGGEIADAAAATRFAELTARRERREPLAYIIGEREFWGLPFLVTPDVLIPRPETEFLLETALAAARGTEVRRALDVGAGSGVIAVVLARELGCEVTALDCSPAALAVAKRNAERHGVSERIRFVESDLFAALPKDERFDLLVSNPPYVAERERGELAPEVVGHEPHQALFAGAEGLDCIAAIARQAGDHLRPGAPLFLEIGAGQGEAARAIFAAAPHHYENIQIRTDWAGRPRVLACRFTA